MQLSILLLAFAHVSDLDACHDLPLCEIAGLLAKSALSMSVSAWDGKAPICIKEDVWFEIIGLLMVGHAQDNVQLEETCLLSSRGWSVFVSTFGDSDPYFTRKYHLFQAVAVLILSQSLVSSQCDRAYLGETQYGSIG